MRELTPLLNVEDTPAAIDFYTKELGFKVVNRFESRGRVVWARLSHGDATIMLNQSEVRSSRSSRTDAASYDDVVLYFGVEDAPKLHRDLVERGLAPGACEPQGYGMHEFTLRDPDGYELAFGSPIAAG